MKILKIGLWNIAQPYVQTEGSQSDSRFENVQEYLNQQDCDILVLTEANAAIQLEGFIPHFSSESPFQNKSKSTEPPNRYHQVAVYTRLPLSNIAISEPINGLLCELGWNSQQLSVYGNVITMKDQWLTSSHKKYSDRIAEQLTQFEQLVKGQSVIIAGDFNLRLGWPQRKGAYEKVNTFVEQSNFRWPTKNEKKTVQHIIHSADLQVDINIDGTIQHSQGKHDSLSDHPFIKATVQAIAA